MSSYHNDGKRYEVNTVRNKLTWSGLPAHHLSNVCSLHAGRAKTERRPVEMRGQPYIRMRTS